MLAGAAVAAALLVGTAVATWQAVRAIQAERHATKEREAAETNYGLAREAIDAYLSAIADAPDLKREDLTRLRARLLNTAIPFYENLIRQRPDGPEQESEHGRAYLRLGSVHFETGDRAASLASCRCLLRLGTAG